MTKTKWIWLAIVAGCAGGGLGVANLIEALKPYATIIAAGSGLVGAIIAFLVGKANEPKS